MGKWNIVAHVRLWNTHVTKPSAEMCVTPPFIYLFIYLFIYFLLSELSLLNEITSVNIQSCTYLTRPVIRRGTITNVSNNIAAH